MKKSLSFRSSAFNVSFFVASPGYTNVNIRIFIDVSNGEFDVYIADSDDRFLLMSIRSNSSDSFKINPPKYNRQRRDTRIRHHQSPEVRQRQRRESVVYIQPVYAKENTLLTYADFTGHVLHVKGLRNRLIVTVLHSRHDLTKQWFYIALKCNNVSAVGQPEAAIYFRQDLPKIDLLLFFLVLTVVLLMVMSGFVLGWKLRVEHNLDRSRGDQINLMRVMASRPLATYTLLCRRKDQHSQVMNKGKSIVNSSSGSCQKVTPIATQITEDHLASISTVFICYPANELSSLNLTLGSGIFQLNNQQLLHVRSNNHGVQGRQVETRILSTIT